LATFSEEEDKLYEQGFDSLYMTGNDKKEPVQSPLFPQPNVDQNSNRLRKVLLIHPMNQKAIFIFTKRVRFHLKARPVIKSIL
jgi:hypothetical protein